MRLGRQLVLSLILASTGTLAAAGAAAAKPVRVTAPRAVLVGAEYQVSLRLSSAGATAVLQRRSRDGWRQVAIARPRHVLATLRARAPKRAGIAIKLRVLVRRRGRVVGRSKPFAVHVAVAGAGQLGLFRRAAPVAHGRLSTPETLPPGTTVDGALNASRVPKAGAPVGTVGVVTAIDPNGFTVIQDPLVAANAAAVVHNVPQAAKLDGRLRVVVGGKTGFVGLGGLAAVMKGMVVVATGRMRGGDLIAASVGSLQVASAPHRAAHTRTAPSVARRRAQATSLMPRDGDVPTTTVSGAFTPTNLPVPVSLRYDTPIVSIDSPPYECYDWLGRKLGTGVASLKLVPQVILSSGGLLTRFPFQVTYVTSPPAYAQLVDGTYAGPGPVPSWLGFLPVAGTDASPTAEVTGGASFGLSITWGDDNCPGANMPRVTIAAATYGYSIDSRTAAAMPGFGQAVKLDAKSCVGINQPVNINFFAGLGGFPDLNPFGSLSAANLSLCDRPTLQGSLVDGAIGDVAGAALSGPPTVHFDPGGVPGTLDDGVAFSPVDSTTSFGLSALSYRPGLIDGYRLEYSLLGVPVISLKASPFPETVGKTPVDVADLVPVTIHAQPTQPRIRLSEFSVQSAAFEDDRPPDFHASADVDWDVKFPSLNLQSGNYTPGTISSSGGTYTTDRSGFPSCGGSLSLDTPDSPKDPIMTVLDDTGSGAGRVWTLQLKATSYGIFFPNPPNSCPTPDFGRYHPDTLWTATVQLKATSDPGEHTQTFNVTSDPSHLGYESWDGTVTLTGNW